MKDKLIKILRWSEKYTKTDMVYFASGNFWLIGSRIIGIGTGMLLTISFANLLTPESFGTYKYIISLLGFVTAFSLSGMSTSVTKSVAQGNQDVARPAFKTSLLWCIPISILTFCASIYYFINNNHTLGYGLLFIALFSPFLNSFVIYKGIMQGKSDFRNAAIYSFPRSILPVLTMILVLFITKNVIIVTATYFLSNFIMSLIMYRLTLRKYNIGHLSSDDPRVKEAVTYGKHLSALGFITQAASQIDILLLWQFVSPAELALYTFATAPIRELRNFSDNFFPLIFPKFATKSVEEIKKNIPLRVMQMSAVSWSMAIIYVLAAPTFFKTLFPQYLSSIGLSQILALSLLVQAKGIIETLFIAHGQVKKRYIAITTTHVVEIVLFIALIPLYGVPGAVIATVVSEMASAIILLYLYKRI